MANIKTKMIHKLYKLRILECKQKKNKKNRLQFMSDPDPVLCYVSFAIFR